jgi:mannan endo-1,4-beta-mannosidase
MKDRKFMKKVPVAASLAAILLCVSACCVFRGGNAIRPVTPHAAPETVQLLKFLYRISGEHTLSGQHNYPGDNDKETLAAAKAWGKTPAIFGKDWGFAKEGDKDSAYVRNDIVSELEEQYKKGSLVVMCWHEVPPTANEPVTFRGRRGAHSTNNLATVQGHLTEDQYRDLLTPGTALHQHWCEQVDAIVPYLKKLQDAHVPVLWRPFHEMNGTWFWWGGRAGKYGSAALYRMMFDRLVNYHKIKNLIWVWNVDRPEGTSLKFEECWPGAQYVDVLSLDCYATFKQSYYADLLKLANGKPIALGEVGGNLSLDVLKSQPKWAWWMVWAGMGLRGEATNRLAAIVQDPQSWSLSDPAYRRATEPIRVASGLPAEPPDP